MLTRSVKVRLAIFAVITVIITVVTAVSFVQLPQLLGINQYTVTANFADASGLYDNALVTYRGADVGKVQAITLKPNGVQVQLRIGDSVRIPADVTATVHSTSAIGEQYVDLVPNSSGTDYLHDGSQIPESRTVGLVSASQVIDSLDTLLRTLPKAQFARTLSDVSTAFGSSGGDLQRLLDSSSALVSSAQANLDPTRALLQDLGPFLRTQQDLAADTTTTLSNLSSFTHQLVLSNSDIVALMHQVPRLAGQVQGLESDLVPALPVLLANLISNGRVLNVYDPAVRQVLTVYPALLAMLIGFAQKDAPTGMIPLYFHFNLNDPPPCEKGFLPPSQRRLPTQTGPAPVPSGLYCKEPPSGPGSVRGARNLPCLNNPGVRAPTPAACVGQPEPDSATARPASGTAQSPSGTAAYQPDGSILAPDGRLYQIGDLASGGKEARTWQDLLLMPIGR